MTILLLLFCLLIPIPALGQDLKTHGSVLLDGKRHVYPVPGKVQSFYESSPQAVSTMLNIAKVHPGDLLYDLGSGTGNVLQAAVGRGVKAVGIEIDPILVYYSREELRGFAEVREADFLKTDFSDATVVTLFLGDDVNLMLRSKLQRLKPGTRIVSNSHGMGDWKPDKTARIPDCGDNNIERRVCQVFMWVVK